MLQCSIVAMIAPAQQVGRSDCWLGICRGFCVKSLSRETTVGSVLSITQDHFLFPQPSAAAGSSRAAGTRNVTCSRTDAKPQFTIGLQ